MALTFHFTFTLPSCLSFLLSLLTFLSRGWGAEAAGREVCRASLPLLTISGQELLLTEKKRRSRDGERADVCSCSAVLHGGPAPAPSQDEDGERATGRAKVALRGGQHPILFTLSLSFFVWGTDHRKRSTWRFNWEFSLLWDR